MNHATDLLLIGGTLLLALAAHGIGQRIHVPRVTLLLLLGALAGPELLDLLPAGADDHFGFITQLTLAMVGFLLGERMAVKNLSEGREAVIVSLAVTLVTAAFVAVAVWLVTRNLPAALLLGSIATATAPAATLDTLKEAGANGPLTRLVFQVVAIDDAWGIVVFGLSMATLGWVIGSEAELALLHALWELGGAVLLGAAIGLPAVWLTGRLRPGEPTQVEAIALILLLAGFSSSMGVSALLASMVAGSLVANLSHHHTRSFREIEHIEWPFLVFFFVLSGASVNLYQATDAIVLTVSYIALRVAGRVLGGYLSTRVAPARGKKLPGSIGLALTPQAGVAIGMALLAAERFPELRDTILPVVVASTIIFELLGPVLVRRVLRS